MSSDFMSPNSVFIAVHVGAGHHSLTKTDEYKTLCAKACDNAVAEWQSSLSVVDVVVKAVSVLEDSPVTNAGVGSSLTEDRTIECDASVTEGTTRRFGAVGGVSGVKNPVILAKRLLEQQQSGKFSHGRIPPAFLVGEGAQKWACENGLGCVSETDMMTKSVLKLYMQYRAKLDKPLVKKRRLEDVCNCDMVSHDVENVLQSGSLTESIRMEVMDTVGAVAVDCSGRTAAGVSSGGLMMKQSGRVGPAAVVGSGCWAEDSDNIHNAVAASTTGCGETLMRTMFARECANALQTEGDDCPTIALQNTITRTVLNAKYFDQQPDRLVGTLMLSYDAAVKHGEVFWAHTTDSMCLAFVSSTSKKAKSRMSRLQEGMSGGQLVVVEGSSFTLH